MLRLRSILASCLLIFTSGSAAAQSNIEDIQTVIQQYLIGTSQGRPELVEEAFLPSLEIQYLGPQGQLLRLSAGDYIGRIVPGVLVAREGRIVAIDATETSAMAKVEITWNGRLYTDYLILLRVEGEWRIANKIASWVPLNGG
jgi:hypothetical protein